MHMAVLGGKGAGVARPASHSDTVQASGVTVPEPVDIPTFDKAGPVKTGPVQLYGLPTG